MWPRSQAPSSPCPLPPPPPPADFDLDAKGELANKAGLGHNWVGTAGAQFE